MNYLTHGITLLIGIFIGSLIVAITLISYNIDINQDTIISGLATFVATCALGLTLWQIQSTRKYNELTLTPRICISTSDYTYLNNNQLIDVTVLNTGLGPAEIHDAYFEYSHKGIKNQYALTKDGIDAYIRMVFTQDPSKGDAYVLKLKKFFDSFTTSRPYREIHSFAKYELLASKYEKTFLRLALPTVEDGSNDLTQEQKEFMKNAARSALDNTKIVIEYQSVYGKSYVYSERFRGQQKL